VGASISGVLTYPSTSLPESDQEIKIDIDVSESRLASEGTSITFNIQVNLADGTSLTRPVVSATDNTLSYYEIEVTTS
jgi:hypothetical protein